MEGVRIRKISLFAYGSRCISLFGCSDCAGDLAVVIVWYYVFASFIATFIVYLVATGGWERVVEMWQRTKYKNK